MFLPFQTVIDPSLTLQPTFQFLPADTFPTLRPIFWFRAHYWIGGSSPLKRISGLVTANSAQIAPQHGFSPQTHRHLEIYTWVLSGELAYESTLGNQGVIRAGEVLRMFSGEGIEHQAFNGQDETVQYVQFMFSVDEHTVDQPPHYQQVALDQLPQRHVDDATLRTVVGDGSPMAHHIKARWVIVELPMNGRTELDAPNENENLLVYILDGDGTYTYRGKTRPLATQDTMMANASAESIFITAENPLRAVLLYVPSFMK